MTCKYLNESQKLHRTLYSNVEFNNIFICLFSTIPVCVNSFFFLSHKSVSCYLQHGWKEKSWAMGDKANSQASEVSGWRQPSRQSDNWEGDLYSPSGSKESLLVHRVPQQFSQSPSVHPQAHSLLTTRHWALNQLVTLAATTTKNANYASVLIPLSISMLSYYILPKQYKTYTQVFTWHMLLHVRDL